MVTGGLGTHATITEAEAMARFLINHGVPYYRILLEDESTSTHENLTFAMEILEEHFGGEFTAVVISNDFHMFRAVGMARRAGFEDVRRMGARTNWRSVPVNYFREMKAVLWFLVGAG